MGKPDLDRLLAAIAAGKPQQVYLTSGDRVVAEPRARKIAEALAAGGGCEVERHHRPPDLAAILADLKTYSLFGGAKVVLAVDSAIFADRSAAAELIDQAQEALPRDDPDAELDQHGREGASRLLQALHVFGLDAAAGEAQEVVDALPKWAFQGGRAYRKKHNNRARPAREVKDLRQGLVTLLEAARAAGLVGYAEGDLAEIGEIVEKGLPEGHALVLAESSVAGDHPVVETLRGRGAFLDAGRVTAGRGGEWEGLRALTDQLAEETSVPIAADAAKELARRTLRQAGEWKRRGVDAESTSRFAGEYRKLASQAAGGRITRKLVETSVEDRGEEDVWQILDAVGGGRGAEATSRYQRRQAAAGDAIAARLSFFGLLAGFCRQLAAVAGMAKLQRVPAGVGSYNQFKSRWAPALQSELEDGAKNPLAGLHPFRLYRAYVAAGRMDRGLLARLPWLVLETEMQVKGESSEADTAIAHLMSRLAASTAGSPPRRAGSPPRRSP